MASCLPWLLPASCGGVQCSSYMQIVNVVAILAIIIVTMNIMIILSMLWISPHLSPAPCPGSRLTLLPLAPGPESAARRGMPGGVLLREREREEERLE